jgi:hypothetical protein
VREKKVKNIKCVTDFDVSGLERCCALRIADTKLHVSPRAEMKVEHRWQMLAPMPARLPHRQVHEIECKESEQRLRQNLHAHQNSAPMRWTRRFKASLHHTHRLLHPIILDFFSHSVPARPPAAPDAPSFASCTRRSLQQKMPCDRDDVRPEGAALHCEKRGDEMHLTSC